MLELCLNVEDLARVRVISTLGMAFEAHMAWGRLGEQRRDALAEWRRAVRHRLRRASATHPVTEPSASLVETLTSPLPRETDTFAAVAVEPFWERVRRLLKAERDAAGRAMLAGGMEQVLNSRHDAIRWEAPVLRVDNAQPPRRTRPGGRGMTLVPSLFAPQPLLIDDRMGWQGLPILVYGVTPDADAAASLWQGGEGEQALHALLGRTRADVLTALRETRSTGQVADRLRISNPSASKHLTILRRAGFVTTERRQNLAVHSLTPLGEAILD
ncbi:winged helix-turn-helix domain-containing protein [Streptomyces tirandamycinicus]|uniref:winged helix-turn-helix domain-containing protein n=1 Tax=Streptomyces TaxID=1883 RepID=UPI002271B4AD|nr:MULTISPECIES: winged helix-turn-helix domain-containing protein [Streptomyces]MCY0984184.1 winged helix-turn-helix domain-containing protein [Streptomyces tirandamycinicus]